MLIVLYIKVDAQCDKLAVIVGQTKLTTLATTDMKFFMFGTNFLEDLPLFVEIPEFPLHSIG